MDKYFQRDIRLHYQIERSRNPWVVFLHGWGSNHSIWRPYVRHFKQRFSILAPDLRAHGRSEEGDYTLDVVTEDLKQLFAKEEVKKPHLVAHSIAAPLAAELASHAASVTFITPCMKGYFLSSVQYMTELLPPGERAFQEYWLDDHTPAPFLLPLDMKGTTRRTRRNSLREALQYEIDWAALPRTQVIQGTYDPFTYNLRLRNHVQHYPHIRTHFLPSHHLITSRLPARIIQKLEVFWS